MQKTLSLIAKKTVTFSDGETRIKHLFIDEAKQPYTGWAETSTQLPDTEISTTGTYEAARARAYEVQVDEYAGKLRYKVRLLA